MTTIRALCFGGPFHGKWFVHTKRSFTVVEAKKWQGHVWIEQKPGMPDPPPDTNTLVYAYDDALDVFLCKAPNLPRIE
jgi:hypothetical protein